MTGLADAAMEPTRTTALPMGWRLLQVALGAVLFLWALGWLDALRERPVPFMLVAGLLAAGAMSVTDALVAGLKTFLERNPNSKGPAE